MQPIRLDVHPSPSAPAAARTALARGLTGHVASPVLADAELLVSELVTNSVRHAGLAPDDLVHVGASVAEGMLRLEVDHAATAGTVAPRAPGADGGFGLLLVDRLADRWGVRGEGRTCVWAELTCWPETG
jgi:anti-sigma regulatory factor (Ser/Thr protein kinase)